MRLCLALLLVAVLLAGCVSYSVVEKGLVSDTDKSYSIELPLNWMRLGVASPRLAVTRDGFGLQNISLMRVAQQDAFPKLKKGAEATLLVSELADLQIAELKSAGQQLANLTVKENIPVQVGGKNGFKLHVQFKNTHGLDFDQVYYAVLHNGYYYTIGYLSPHLYYFDKYLREFEQTVATFKLT